MNFWGVLHRPRRLTGAHTPPRVGSIRSARLIDLELVAMYGALFVYSGASEPIRERIAASEFAARAYGDVTTGDPLYFRHLAIDLPHNLVVHDGVAIGGLWRRGAHDTPLTFWTDEETPAPLPLKPGNTWFEVVPPNFDGVPIG